MMGRWVRIQARRSKSLPVTSSLRPARRGRLAKSMEASAVVALLA
jgi:hypothetical protein